MHVDKKRSERHFAVGDSVYLKLIPYQLSSLAPHSYHKLQPRYNGPYEVIEKIGAIAYKLKLHVESKIHPVFHVSNLKRQLGSNNVLHSTLLHVLEDVLS